MPRRAPFLSKVLNRLEKIDQKAVSEYLKDLSQENALLQEVLDTVHEGVFILNEDRTVFYANDAVKHWLNIPSERLEERPRIRDLVQDSELQRWLAANLATPQDRVMDELKIILPRELHLRVHLAPLTNGTDRKILWILTNRMQDPASEKERVEHITALLKLAAGIAHEIGNPLNSIGIHLELLKKQVAALGEPRRKTLAKHLEVLRSETDRLDRIVRNFLKVTRKPPLRLRMENLNQLVEEAVEIMKPELDRNKIEVKFEKDPRLPLCLADRERLHQVFLNLIKNSMEAMPRGGVIQIRIDHKDKVAWLEFKDSGGGIDEADLPYIFDAYFTTKEGGSGLGLMTVYNIIREHGGRIEVDSRLGKGAVFTLILPLRTPKLQLPGPKKS